MLMHYLTPYLNCINSYYLVPFNIYNSKFKLTIKTLVSLLHYPYTKQYYYLKYLYNNFV